SEKESTGSSVRCKQKFELISTHITVRARNITGKIARLSQCYNYTKDLSFLPVEIAQWASRTENVLRYIGCEITRIPLQEDRDEDYAQQHGYWSVNVSRRLRPNGLEPGRLGKTQPRANKL
ncbi:hypothetical protein V5799_032322, partial [Amblyomma americanum]